MAAIQIQGLDENVFGWKDNIMTTSREVVNNLFYIYVTGENISNTEDEIRRLTNSSNKKPLQNAEKLLSWLLRRGCVHEKQDLNDIFFKGLNTSIRQSIRGY